MQKSLEISFLQSATFFICFYWDSWVSTPLYYILWKRPSYLIHTDNIDKQWFVIILIICKNGRNKIRLLKKLKQYEKRYDIYNNVQLLRTRLWPMRIQQYSYLIINIHIRNGIQKQLLPSIQCQHIIKNKLKKQKKLLRLEINKTLNFQAKKWFIQDTFNSIHNRGKAEKRPVMNHKVSIALPISLP